MRYPKTPDLDIVSGVHIIRSLHVKKENKCGGSAINSMSDIGAADCKESKKPTWLVFDKQVSANGRRVEKRARKFSGDDDSVMQRTHSFNIISEFNI